MNLITRLLGFVLPALAAAPPVLGADLVTDPGAVAGIVSMTDGQLEARKITKVVLGDVVLSSGHIVATDPLVQPDRPAFLVTVPPGRYPVTLYQFESRTAAAVMRFAPGHVFRWQLAMIEGQDVKTLKPGEFFGYGVDTGLGSYMDKATAALIDERDKAVQAEKGASYISYYDDVLFDELGPNGDVPILHQPVASKPGNVAIFSSGWGDGFYPVYWGLDAEGRPIVLLTDFQILPAASNEGTGQ
ncbi:MAG: DUF4241 domain-containing protein [Alphaproteobacteria bacterium]|nr:MAG: DUF4241 domain-containing protein [Alphaproteobacteria bacterium]